MHPLHDYIANQIGDRIKDRRVVVMYDKREELKRRYFRKPAPEVVPPSEFASRPRGSVAQDSVLAAGQVYFPYFSIDTVFEDEATRARLEPEGILASPLSDYLERLLDFATRSRWGKRPIARVDALPT